MKIITEKSDYNECLFRQYVPGYRAYSHQGLFIAINPRINLANRYGITGIHGEMDAYPKISENNYGYMNYGFSQSDVFPKNRLNLKTRSLSMEFNHIFNHVWIFNTGAALGNEELETGTFSGYYTFDINISRLF